VKVVLDTNVLVSAVLTAHGTCARIIDLLVDGTFSLLADDRILAEYTDVLQRPELHLVRKTSRCFWSWSAPARTPSPRHPFPPGFLTLPARLFSKWPPRHNRS
jgi:hypothetical protein